METRRLVSVCALQSRIYGILLSGQPLLLHIRARFPVLAVHLCYLTAACTTWCGPELNPSDKTLREERDFI